MPHHWAFERDEPLLPEDYIIERERMKKEEKDNYPASNWAGRIGGARCKDCGEIYNKFTSKDLSGKRCNLCLEKRTK